MGLLSGVSRAMRGGAGGGGGGMMGVAAGAAESGAANMAGDSFMASKEALAAQIGDPAVADMIRQARDYSELGTLLQQIRMPFGKQASQPMESAASDFSPYAPRNELSPYVR
jgi:hypothetical protein